MSDEAPDQVGAAVRETIDPTAPTTRAAPADLAQVAPPVADAPVWLPWLGLAGAVGAGVLAVVAVRTGGTAWPLDRSLHGWVLAHRSVSDAALARVVTWGGATTIVLPTVAVVGAVLPRGRRGLRTRLGSGLLLSATASLGVWLGLVVNHAVGRERPPVADWWGAAGGPAFPSGHTTAATVAAATVAWAVTAVVRSTRGRIMVWSAAALYAVTVGWSRVWLGVHWPSDVLAGWLLGASWVALVVAGVAVAERGWARHRAHPWARATAPGPARHSGS